VEVGNGEPCAGVEVGKAGQLGQVLAAAAARPHPRPAHQAWLRQLLNNRRRILRILCTGATQKVKMGLQNPLEKPIEIADFDRIKK
jgi:hypothetical protein